MGTTLLSMMLAPGDIEGARVDAVDPYGITPYEPSGMDIAQESRLQL
jgi:hypothetical protein